MKILKLTPAVEKKLLRSRQERDLEAEGVAAEIIVDVRRRSDTALFEWIKKLDGIDTRRDGLWITKKKIAAARKCAGPRHCRNSADNIPA